MSSRIVFADGDPLAGELLAGGLASRLQRLGTFEFYPAAPESAEEYISRLEGADGILLGWHLPAEVMRAARDLKIVAFTGTGAVNFVDMAQARERDIVVTNTPGYADQAVAEHTLALTLGVMKQLGTDREVRAGGWGASHASAEFGSTTIGVVGLGGIGARFAELAVALGFRVIAWNRSWDTRTPPAGVVPVSLDELLAGSDIVSLHLSLSEKTTGFLDAAALGRMKPGAALINTARAELVDRAALLEALDSSRISAAGIDVFHTEPLPADDEILSLPNVLVTPHIGSFTVGATRRVLEIAVDNLEAFFAGAPRNVVS